MPGLRWSNPAPALPWGGIRPCWVIKSFTSLKCLALTLILLIWDLSVISRDENLLLGKRENPLTNMNTEVCSDKRPSAVCLLSNPNICDRINVGFAYGKINKKWRLEGSHILQSCVLHIFCTVCIFLAHCVLSLCFIVHLPGCKRLQAPANFAHIPEMTCKSQNNKVFCKRQMHSGFFMFKPRVKSSGFWCPVKS